jgi:hypothetical protein
MHGSTAEHSVPCGGCSTATNASLPRGRLFKFVFDPKSHRLLEMSLG